MNLSFPVQVETSKNIFEAFFLDLLSLVQIQCLIPHGPDVYTKVSTYRVPSGVIHQIYVAYVWMGALGIFTIGMFVPSCLKFCLKHCFEDAEKNQVDRLYNFFGTILSFVVVKAVKMIFIIGNDVY